MLQQILDIWITMAPWLLVGAAAAALLHVLLPAGFVQRHLSGRLGVLKAVLIGIPLPLCSCAVIPAGLGLKKSGASDGAAVGFLISTPQTGVDSILVSGSLLGWPFAILKVIVALITGWVGGLLSDRKEAPKPSLPVLNSTSTTAVSHVPRLKQFWQHFLMLLQSLWGWLVLGVLISAAISEWLPKETLSGLPGFQGWPSLLLVMLIATPLYVCATASVPIAAALVGSGLPPGAALVFLMAGPATNVATIGAVYRTLGQRSLVVYLGAIGAGSLVAGAVFNKVLSADVVAQHIHLEVVTWWEIAAAGALGLLMLWFAFEDCRAWFRNRKAVSVLNGRRFKVEGMTCNGCASQLKNRLLAAAQVTSADVSFPEGTATILGDAEDDQIQRIAQEAGFAATPVEAEL